MTRPAGLPTNVFLHGDAALLTQISGQCDDLHRFVAKDAATSERHVEVAERLCQLSPRLSSPRQPSCHSSGSTGSSDPDDRMLLAELSSLHSDVGHLAMNFMDGAVMVDEQQIFARYHIGVAAKLQARTVEPWVIDNDAPVDGDNGRNSTVAQLEP